MKYYLYIYKTVTGHFNFSVYCYHKRNNKISSYITRSPKLMFFDQSIRELMQQCNIKTNDITVPDGYIATFYTIEELELSYPELFI